MFKVLLMSSAYGWFAGLLTIMIVVCALFGLILFIALRPIKKDELADDSAAKKLKRRETELTIELLNKQNDKAATDELISKLREVKSAEQLVDELMEEDNEVAVSAAPAKAPKSSAVKPAAKAHVAESKAVPANAAPKQQTAQPAAPATEKESQPKQDK